MGFEPMRAEHNKLEHTLMKVHFIFFSIIKLLKSEMSKVKARHNKKMDNLLALKRAIDGLQENPNNVILNFAARNLSDEQIDVLKLGFVLFCYTA